MSAGDGKGMNETQKAIAQAVFDSIPEFDRQEILDAISEGVYRAVSNMIHNGTRTPCQDFYEAINKAAKEAFEVVTVGLKDEPPKPVKLWPDPTIGNWPDPTIGKL